jgi:RimJ/RimL family protein N-acetyltransferase
VARKVDLVKLGSVLEDALMSDAEYREALRQGNWARAAERVHGVVGPTVPRFAETVEEPTWDWYFVGDGVTRDLVGACAYKAPPTEDGEVEIAYFTYPPFEGRGYATAMARKLIAMASRSPMIGRVIAHTLPMPSASTRVLETVGMTFVGEVMDPEDGRVWRWQIESGNR